MGGVLSYVISAWPGSLYRKLGVVSLINAGLVLAAVMFVLTRGAEIGTFDLGRDLLHDRAAVSRDRESSFRW